MTDITEPVVEMGADVDVTALMADVAAEVARKRDAGLYPPEVLVELEVPAVNGAGGGLGRTDPAAALGPALADMQRSSRFTALVTTASRKPVVAPVIAGARRAIRASLTWYMNGILEQVSRFADNSVRAVGLVGERTAALDDRIARLERRADATDAWASGIDGQRVPEQLARLESRIREVRNRLEEGVRAAREGAGTGEGIGDGIGEGIGDDIGDGTPRPRAGAWSWASERNFDYVDFENHFRGSVEEITERQRRYVAEFVGATGPVVDLGCGRGEFLGLLAEAGVAAYGVDRHPDMVTTTRAKGFEVVEADAFEHLASVEPGSLGGIFCAQMVEHLAPAEVPTFFELANRALAVGAPVIVETINPESLFVFAHAFYVDLGHLRPLHPLTLEFLAQAAGFGSVRVDYVSPIPPEFRPQPLPPVEDEPLAAVVAGLDENFRRIDDLLFAPQDFAVVARR